MNRQNVAMSASMADSVIQLEKPKPVMTTVISVANQKGGVAKTTTTRHLAHFLGAKGVRTLVIDNDHQANLTQYFGFDPVELDRAGGSMYHVIAEGRSLNDITVPVNEFVHLAPSMLSLAEAGNQLQHEIDVNGVLKARLREALPYYDVVLIDCSPNLERLLINALMASTHVLIPTKTDSLSVSGIPALIQTIIKVRAINENLQVLGVLPTIYHAGHTADEKALERLQQEAGGVGVTIFDPIPAATNYNKAADERQAVFVNWPDTKGREQYEQLAEVITAL